MRNTVIGTLNPYFYSLLLSLTWLVPQTLVAQNSSVKVRVAPAKSIAFSDRVEALGTLRANESVSLTANVSETITAIHFEDGQKVNVGDVLVEMTSSEEDALLVEAETNALEANRQLKRIRQLVSAGTASESLLDQRQRDFDAAQARLRATQSRLKDLVISAPFSGTVGLRLVSVGALVRPGDVITTLTDDSKMKLDFSVPSVFISTLTKGLNVEGKSRAYDEQTFSGTVASINNQVDPVTRTITVRALLPNPDGLLKQGMLMQLSLDVNPRDAIVIPEAALMPESDRNFVMLARQKDGAYLAERKQVQIRGRRFGEVEVQTGLDAGDLVITHGAFKIKPGTEVVFDTPAATEAAALVGK